MGAVLSLGACAAAALLRGTAFVPPSGVTSPRAAQLSTAACAAALLGAAENAHADAIGDAAGKLSKAAYPFMKEVPWNSYPYSTSPGSKDAVAWAKAIGKMIDMGAAMDTKLLKAGADAHHAAIGGLPASGVCSEAQLTAINAAIGRMIASVPESKTMDVYNSVSALVDSRVPAYPFIKDVDWTSDLFLKPIPGGDPQKVMKAVDKMIVMGSAMDGAALKEASQAHVKAIDGVDAKGVLSQGDFEAINAGLGKAIASVPTSKVMDVYNSMAGVIGSSP